MSDFPRISAIIDAAAKHYYIPREYVLSRRNSRMIVRARHVSIYLAREGTDFSLSTIGEVFERDHSTVFYAHRKIESELETYASLREDVEAIIDSLDDHVLALETE